MDTLSRFGTFNFIAKRQISLRDNFRDVVPRTTRLPGLSGGFDEFGDDSAPGEIGNVQVTFWIFADSDAEMQSFKEEIGQLADWGVKRLYKQPVDADSAERYCEARINGVDYTESSKKQPHKRIRVQINFQVANPVWLTQGTESSSWGDGTTWGGGTSWGGGATANACSGLQNDFSLTVEGNAATYPRITVSCGAAQTVTSVKIQRLENGNVVDEVDYAAALGNNDTLEINCRAKSIKKNGSDAYSSVFTFLNARWFRLEGGETNDIRVILGDAGDACDVYFRYFEAYK